jgi:hypothetical protein
MSKNIPPVAEKVICVDFDGTLFEWGDLEQKTQPFIGAVQVMRDLRKAGWEIVIFTSRLSPTWWEAEGMDFKGALITQTAFVSARLENFGIPFDRITAEKVPAEYYIDDKAIEFTGKPFSWKEIGERIL